MISLRRPILMLLAVAVTALLPGCQTPRTTAKHAYTFRSKKVIKPVVAVMDFENLASGSGQWNLGRGMADLLVTELMDSEKVTVLERRHLQEVMSEIMLQGGGLFRKEGRVAQGRLKNAKYLLRGAVTDFTITAQTSAWFGSFFLRLFGQGNRARVAITARLYEVETGEVISSVKASCSVSSGGFGTEASYKGISFGGDTFFRTPLGRATEGAIHTAMKRVLRELPVEYWQPCVAECSNDFTVINGGENAKVRVGDEFAVRDTAREINDPLTGNLIETVPGRVLGRIRVTRVNPYSAYAVYVSGIARRGLFLEPLQK